LSIYTALNEILIPRNSLVVLCGPAGSGKSTWAAKHFLPTQIVSSDECRALVFDDAADQSVSGNAFELLHFIIEKRLTLGRLTVADATNLRREHRGELIKIANRFFFNSAAIVFDVAVEICLERNADRDRKVPPQALMNQYESLEKTLRTIDSEGFNYLYVLNQDSQSGAAVSIGRQVSRRPPPPVPESESRA
jgi:protein phosphatase